MVVGIEEGLSTHYEGVFDWPSTSDMNFSIFFRSIILVIDRKLDKIPEAGYHERGLDRSFYVAEGL